ncbi:serine hydrolase domain-containing protein, partial [Pantoea sp.]|uniref:serine hydrolase domain-containing protein n=1 Tax=Pantoea sp. TaxID=69393 RepID=UPI0039181881
MTISPVSLSIGAAPGNLSANIQTVVQLALEQQRLVGTVVLVARDGQLLYQQAAGWADRESCRAMTVDTIFRLASVSKPITSTAALGLVAQGHLDLDDSIDRWLP